MGSDHRCDCIGSREDAPPGTERKHDGVISPSRTAKAAQTTYVLEESNGVRSWMQFQSKQKRHTS
jgi:hypothetical protein